MGATILKNMSQNDIKKESSDFRKSVFDIHIVFYDYFAESENLANDEQILFHLRNWKSVVVLSEASDIRKPQFLRVMYRLEDRQMQMMVRKRFQRKLALFTWLGQMRKQPKILLFSHKACMELLCKGL